MKKILTCALVLASLNCFSQSDTLSNWKYRDKVNEMTSDHYYYAEAEASSGSVTTTLLIRHNKGGNKVLLSIDNGIFNMGVNGMTLRAKFDDSKIQRIGGGQPDDGSFTTLFISPANSFIKKLKASKVTFLEVELYNGGTRTFKFNTANFKWEY